MSDDRHDRLVMMANQIARNLAHADDPVAETAAHIRQFWTPAMIAGLGEVPQERLAEPARAALDALNAALR